MGRVNAIPNDVLKSKIGYTSSSENTNPLRPGTSKDFAGIVASQMAMGRMHAARIMKEQPAVKDVDDGGEALQDIVAENTRTEEINRQTETLQMSELLGMR
ncbi:MAG: hypothetical protein HFI94_01540 [Lachnospiraceae bacterium]|nr:hypothetical protein [Lachnospiraceae bacterium]